MPASPGSDSRLRKISAAATSVPARSTSVASTRGSSADAISARAAACGSPRRACSSTSRRQAVPASGPGPAFSMQVCRAARAPSSSPPARRPPPGGGRPRRAADRQRRSSAPPAARSARAPSWGRWPRSWPAPPVRSPSAGASAGHPARRRVGGRPYRRAIETPPPRRSRPARHPADRGSRARPRVVPASLPAGAAAVGRRPLPFEGHPHRPARPRRQGRPDRAAPPEAASAPRSSASRSSESPPSASSRSRLSSRSRPTTSVAASSRPRRLRSCAAEVAVVPGCSTSRRSRGTPRLHAPRQSARPGRPPGPRPSPAGPSPSAALSLRISRRGEQGS